jgi:hypothetical protein
MGGLIAQGRTLLTKWDTVYLDTFLFQFHEEQDENRPHPDGYWKLNQLCIAQRASSWNRKRKRQDGQGREYPEGQLGFEVHGGS